MLLGSGGTVYLTQVSVNSSYVGGLLPALLILGLGFGMIFAPGINAATAGVRREDSGVASALVNTVQQVGGSIGTSALSTIALTATASYLIAHHASPLAPAIAATHGYTLAFAISAALMGLGFILAIVLLPSKRRLAELRTATSTAAARTAPEPAPEPTPTPVPIPAPTHAPEPGFEAIPVALCSCSPLMIRVPGSARYDGAR
jgi:MFS family permease